MKPSSFFSLLFILYFCPFTILKGQENKTDSVSLCKEAHLDSLWRKENIWNLGVAKITGESIKDLSTIEAPKWAKWGYDLENHR